MSGKPCHPPSDHSYTLRVVGSGIKAQSTNPEVKVKAVDPVVSQIIDKLKHINQVSSCIFTSLSLSFFRVHPSFHMASKNLLIVNESQMQKHLQAAKGPKSIITHLETYLIWLPSHIYSHLFLCFKISEAFLSPSMPLCTFVLRLLSGLFMSQDDEIKDVLWRFFTRIAAAMAACGLLRSGAAAASHVCPAGVPGGRLKARSPLLTSCWHPFPD